VQVLGVRRLAAKVGIVVAHETRQLRFRSFEIPAKRSSFTNRPCNVANARSMRALIRYDSGHHDVCRFREGRATSEGHGDRQSPALAVVDDQYLGGADEYRSLYFSTSVSVRADSEPAGRVLRHALLARRRAAEVPG
jgi:hypothetical protein